MTAAGIVNGPGGIAIGADSCVTWGASQRRTDGKLLTDGPWAFAAAGAQEAAIWLREHRPAQEPQEDAATYVQRIGPLVRAWLAECDAPHDRRDAMILIAHCDGAAWALPARSGVAHLLRGCFGAGDSTAVEAAFLAARPWRSTNAEALHDALTACAEVCAGVCHPIRVARWSVEDGAWEVIGG